MKVGGVSITASKTTVANTDRAPEWTDSSSKADSTTAATSGAAASTAGVIKLPA